MRDAVRVILIDPNARSRQSLQKQLEAMGDVEVIEACPAYQLAVRRVAALRPELAVVVLDDDVEQALAVIEAIAKGMPEVSVVPAGEGRESSVILRAVRSGAREFLPLPANQGDLAETLRRVCPCGDPGAESGPRGPHVVAITGAAGGVGCSSLAVNLATSLTKLSRRDSVLVDFDLLLGSLEESLAVIPDNSLEVVVRNIDDMDPALLKRWLPRHPSGLYVLPHPVSMEEAARLEPEALQDVLELLKDTFATVVIDTSKGFQTSDFLAFEAADVIVVVLQLTLNCTRNTVRLLQYFRQFEGFEEKVKLVVNRVNSPLSEISLRKAEELLKTRVSWQIPNATRLFRPARTRGLPIDEVEGGAGSKAHEAVMNLARELHPFPVERAKGRRTLFKTFSPRGT